MSEPDARRIAELIAARDTIEEWLESFEESLVKNPGYRLLSFDDINAVRMQSNDDEVSKGWQGVLRMPIGDAIGMLKRQIMWINGELRGLGVAAPS